MHRDGDAPHHPEVQLMTSSSFQNILYERQDIKNRTLQGFERGRDSNIMRLFLTVRPMVFEFHMLLMAVFSGKTDANMAVPEV